MRNICLTIAYRGTNFCGWQIQPQVPTIQDEMQTALSRMTKDKIRLQGASRTDSGVHARGQVANFFTQKDSIPIKAFVRGLNTMLPDDIVVRNAKLVDFEFHSKRHSKKKIYTYHLSWASTPSPFSHDYHWRIQSPLNVEAMQEATLCLVGKHDFNAFRALNCGAKHAVRQIYWLSVREQKEDRLEIEICGNAFAKNMVRIMVGTLVELGQGKIDKKQLQAILASRDRKLAGITAPAKGLFLETVFY